jgi:transposase
MLARWSLCVVNQAGEILVHRHLKAAPAPCLTSLAPYREDRVVCVESLFTWSWRADLCAHEGMPCVLGHALSMQAIHAGKAKNATIDAHTMAVLLRGGLVPHADVYPAERRATRDLLRRRRQLRRQRAAWLAPSQQTNRPYHLPESGTQLADTTHRVGVAERCPEPAVQQRLAVDLARIHPDDRRRTDLERSIVQPATEPEAHTCSRWRSSPGVGTILARGRLDAIHAIRRCPRVQACVASGRLVTWAQASAGQRDGPAGQTIGHADLTWACSDAAVRCWRNHPAGQQDLARLAKKPGPGQAFTGLAQTWARAVSDLLTRDPACDLDTWLPA